jgi:hypothetical protein
MGHVIRVHGGMTASYVDAICGCCCSLTSMSTLKGDKDSAYPAIQILSYRATKSPNPTRLARRFQSQSQEQLITTRSIHPNRPPEVKCQEKPTASSRAVIARFQRTPSRGFVRRNLSPATSQESHRQMVLSVTVGFAIGRDPMFRNLGQTEFRSGMLRQAQGSAETKRIGRQKCVCGGDTLRRQYF